MSEFYILNSDFYFEMFNKRVNLMLFLDYMNPIGSFECNSGEAEPEMDIKWHWAGQKVHRTTANEHPTTISPLGSYDDWDGQVGREEPVLPLPSRIPCHDR